MNSEHSNSKLNSLKLRVYFNFVLCRWLCPNDMIWSWLATIMFIVHTYGVLLSKWNCFEFEIREETYFLSRICDTNPDKILFYTIGPFFISTVYMCSMFILKDVQKTYLVSKIKLARSYRILHIISGKSKDLKQQMNIACRFVSNNEWKKKKRTSNKLQKKIHYKKGVSPKRILICFSVHRNWNDNHNKV